MSYSSTVSFSIICEKHLVMFKTWLWFSLSATVYLYYSTHKKCLCISIYCPTNSKESTKKFANVQNLYYSQKLRAISNDLRSIMLISKVTNLCLFSYHFHRSISISIISIGHLAIFHGRLSLWLKLVFYLYFYLTHKKCLCASINVQLLIKNL